LMGEGHEDSSNDKDDGRKERHWLTADQI
jgi:hypothetical protein